MKLTSAFYLGLQASYLLFGVEAAPGPLSAALVTRAKNSCLQLNLILGSYFFKFIHVQSIIIIICICDIILLL